MMRRQSNDAQWGMNLMERSTVRGREPANTYQPVECRSPWSGQRSPCPQTVSPQPSGFGVL